MSTYNLAIELNNNTIIYKVGYGIVLKEPSIIAVQQQGKRTVVKEVGYAAQKLIGKSPEDVEIIQPILGGVIVNKEYAILMLKEFYKRVNNKKISNDNTVLLLPSSLSPQEKNEFLNLLYSVNIRSVEILPSVLACLYQMEIEEDNPYSNMVVNMHNVTDIAVVNNGHIVQACMLDIGTNIIDIVIKTYLKDSYNIDATISNCKEMRKTIGTLLPNDISNYTISGSDINDFGSNEVNVESQELRPIFIDYFTKVCGGIEGVLNMCSSEVIADINKRGIYLCGELCNITGVERFMRSKLNLPVYCDVEPTRTTILGGGELLNNPKTLNSLIMKNK